MIQRSDETNLPSPKPCRSSRGEEAAEEGGAVAKKPAHSIHHDVQNQINPSGPIERRRARWRQEGARWTTKPSTERGLEICSAVRLEEEQVLRGALQVVDVTELPRRPRTLDENDRLLTNKPAPASRERNKKKYRLKKNATKVVTPR